VVSQEHPELPLAGSRDTLEGRASLWRSQICRTYVLEPHLLTDTDIESSIAYGRRARPEAWIESSAVA
jgi:hypothetical protein